MPFTTTLRRWLQFSLAELLVGTILLGAGVGIYVTRSSSTFQHDLKLADVREARLIAPDMMLVLCSNKSEDQLFKVNLRSGKQTPFELNPAPQISGRIVAFEVSRDRKKLLLRKGTNFIVCNVSDGKVTNTITTGYCSSFVFSVHGNYISAPDVFITTSVDTSVTVDGLIYDATTSQTVSGTRLLSGVREFLADDSRVLCDEPPNVVIREFPSQKEITRFNCGQMPNSVLAVSDDESCFGIEDSDRAVKLFNPENGNAQGQSLKNESTNPLVEIAFEPDGKRLAVSTVWSTISVWDRGTGKQVALIDTGAINQYTAFPERGRLLTLTADGKLAVRRVGANNSEIALYIVAACALAVLILLRLFRRLPAKKRAA